MFQTTGTLKYYDDYCVAYVDNEIAKYYRKLLPKSININQQRYDSHVTVVRKNIERADTKFWKKWDGKTVNILYSSGVQTCGTFFWLDCVSPEISAIRKELGLPEFRNGYYSYHITIGNIKHETNYYSAACPLPNWM